MRLPEQLQQEFIAEFKREPYLVLRAICDITGEPGLTWLACDGTVLACFSKPAGGEFMRYDYRIGEATAIEIGNEDEFLLLRARFPELEFVLRLPLSEGLALQQLVELLPKIDTVNTVRAPAALTPHLVCAAAVYALVQSDGEAAKEELDWVVARFGDQQSFRRGGAWLLKHGFAALTEQAARLLTPAQLETMVLILLDLGFCDNRLSRHELTMLEEWKRVAGMTPDRYQHCYDTLLAGASLGGLVREIAGELEMTGINLLCAAMLGVVQHRPETAERRIKALERRVQSMDAINNGQTYLDQLGPEGLVTFLREMLDPAQRRCVLANVMAEAFQDGELTPELGAYVRLLGEGMGDDAAAFEADMRLFRLHGNTELFHEGKRPRSAVPAPSESVANDSGVTLQSTDP